MSNFDDYYFLGKIIKPHGFDGKVNAYLDTDDPYFYDGLEMVFVNHNNNPVPYFLEQIIIKSNKATIKFQDVDDADTAAVLVQKEMYLPLSALPPLTGKKFYYHEVKGFFVIDIERGPLGAVENVLEYPNQAVLQIMVNEKEVLIPVSDEVIRKVDRSKREIEVKAPDGLLEIYLD